jgi:hypothetical protein
METDTHLYTLTRLEFAKTIGKSKEAVKKDMQRGKYKNLYIFKDGKYYFKSREAVRENKGLSPVDLYPVKKSKINRGGHESAVRKGRYPNNAFAEHNHMKKMIALRGKMTPEELAMVPDVERMVKQERQKRLQEEYEAKLPPRDNTRGGSYSNYGSGIFNESNGGYSDPYYHSGRAHERHPSKFEASRGKTIEDSAFPYWKPKYY